MSSPNTPENFFNEKSVTRNRVERCDLLTYASNNREEGDFNDVTVYAGDWNVKANSMVLSYNSRYFEKLFKTDLKGKYQPVVVIKDVNGTSVKTIIDYFYRGSIDIDSNTVISLLAAADYLKVEDVKKFCGEFLESVVSPMTAISILKKAKSSGVEPFTNWVYQYISDHLDEIAITSDFKCQSKADFVSCVSRNNIKQAEEESKYHALMSWIEYDDEEKRNEVFVELFEQLVNLEKVSIAFNKEILLQEKLIKNNTACYEQVLTAFSKLLEVTSLSYFQSTQSKVVSLGGYYTHTKVFDLFNVQGQPLLNYPDLPKEMYSHCSLNLSGLVFCIGGKTDFIGGVSNEMWQCNLKQKIPEWRKMDSMNEKRSDMGAAVHRSHLVVAGGNNEGKVLDSTEHYAVEKNEWKTISSLKQSREAHELVSCDDCVYALGGKEDIEIFSSVEILQDLHKHWQEGQPMLTPRHSFAAVNCKGCIYAIGGRTEANSQAPTKSVERYDAATGSWSYVKAMKTARYGHSACVLNGKIIVAGGIDGNLKQVSKIECYDPSNDTWSCLGAISEILVCHNIVAM